MLWSLINQSDRKLRRSRWYLLLSYNNDNLSEMVVIINWPWARVLEYAQIGSNERTFRVDGPSWTIFWLLTTG